MSLSSTVTVPLTFQDASGEQQCVSLQVDLRDTDVIRDTRAVAEAFCNRWALGDTCVPTVDAAIATALHTHALTALRLQGREITPFMGSLPGPSYPFPPGTINPPQPSPAPPMVAKPLVPTLRPSPEHGLYGPPRAGTGAGPSTSNHVTNTAGVKRSKPESSRHSVDAAPSSKRKRADVHEGRAGGIGAAGRSKGEEESGGGEGGDGDGVSDDGNFAMCERCDAQGDLLCCDRCPRSFHPRCVGLNELPAGDWYCPACALAFGPDGKWENSTAGPVCTTLYDGPFNGPRSGAGSTREQLTAALAALKAHEFADPFLIPVPPTNKAYYGFVPHPMDFSTVTSKLDSGAYEQGDIIDAARLITDIRLIFHNCKEYNRHMGALWRMADALSRQFETALRDTVRLTDRETVAVTALRASELTHFNKLRAATMAHTGKRSMGGSSNVAMM